LSWPVAASSLPDRQRVHDHFSKPDAVAAFVNYKGWAAWRIGRKAYASDQNANRDLKLEALTPLHWRLRVRVCALR